MSLLASNSTGIMSLGFVLMFNYTAVDNRVLSLRGQINGSLYIMC